MSKLYAYKYPEDVIELEDYIIMDSFNMAYYCANNHKAGYNVNTIIKILNNWEGYFDFSKNFIDIGSRLGEFPLHLANVFNHVYTFEPNKKSAALIYVNCLLANNLDKVDVFNDYLSDCKKEIKYNGWCNVEDGNILAQELTEGVKLNHDGEHLDDNVYKIETHTLDEYSFNNIGFIKIDVEGAEYDVIKGAAGTIIRNECPPILFELLKPEGFKNEYLYENYKNNLYTLLYSLGYCNIIQYGEDPQNYLALK